MLDTRAKSVARKDVELEGKREFGNDVMANLDEVMMMTASGPEGVEKIVMGDWKWHVSLSLGAAIKGLCCCGNDMHDASDYQRSSTNFASQWGKVWSSMVVVVELVPLYYSSLPDAPDWGSRACAYVCLEREESSWYWS
jgi:hypothetical protein